MNTKRGKRVRVAVEVSSHFVRMLNATVQLKRLLPGEDQTDQQLTALEALGVAVLLEARGAEKIQIEHAIPHDWYDDLKVLYDLRQVTEEP